MKKEIINQDKINENIVGAYALKSAQGITLISLIITIIIMLILVGVVLNITIGERGIFRTAKEGTKKYEIERIKEKVNLEILDLSSEKLAKGEKLTKEEALIEIQKREVFEEIDLEEDTGICEGNVIILGYDENGNVIILGIEKDREVRVQVSLEPKGYTNGKIEAKISVKTSNQKITKLEIPEGISKKEEGIYEIEKNGTYVVKATLENGEIIEKEIKIAQIDKLAPKAFTIEAEETETGFKIKGETEDAKADEENVRSGIEHYEYYVNGELQEGNELKGLEAGTYKVYGIAYDKAGNASDPTEEIEVIISTKVKNIIAGNRNINLVIDEKDRVWSAKAETYTKKFELQSWNINFDKVSTSKTHSLAIDKNGELWSWGENSHGQLGDGYISNKYFYEPIHIELGIKFKEVSAGNNFSIAIDEEGRIWSWGNCAFGKLGNGEGTNKDEKIPKLIDTNIKFKKIAASSSHVIAIDEDENLWGWGANNYGAIGINNISSAVTVPTLVEGKVKFKEVSTGSNISIAIDENGKLWSWGSNSNGMLGTGLTSDKLLIPTLIETEIKFEKVCTGKSNSNYIVALDENGKLWSWGKKIENYAEIVTEPTKIEIDVKFSKIDVGDYYAMAIDVYGNLYTWGNLIAGPISIEINYTNIPTRFEI